MFYYMLVVPPQFFRQKAGYCDQSWLSIGTKCFRLDVPILSASFWSGDMAFSQTDVLKEDPLQDIYVSQPFLPVVNLFSQGRILSALSS